MKIRSHFINILHLSLILWGISFNGQNLVVSDKITYQELRKQYENKPENDRSAMPLINDYLKKAKKEGNYRKIFQGYQDAAFYSDDKTKKLKYADSCVQYALQSKNNELISSAYLEKGVIYYFFYKQYQPALNEYLKAYEYSENIKDDFLRYRIIYHLGVVKSYLGYYSDALKLFKECSAHFEPLTRANIHPNLIYNNKKGYFNSLHQQIICYGKLQKYPKSDSLIKLGLSATSISNEFDLENAYFRKSLGISDFRKKKYTKAIENISIALPQLKKINDFTSASVSYFYIGKAYQEIKKEEVAVSYFVKVDSIFQKQQFITPELRENYESLINYYHKIKNPGRELYYTKQLLIADQILTKDFQYLSDKIHKEYDTKALLEKQKHLENKNSIGFLSLIASSVLILILLSIIIYRKKKEKEIQSKYIELGKRITKEENSETDPTIVTEPVKENKTSAPTLVINDILKKLNDFEKKRGFIKKGITQQELAKNFGTNTTYLSQVINEYKGKKFNTYLNELRIMYITQELYHNPKFLDYTIEGLSEKCGISSRQNFSDFFNEINGIRPADFIKKRKAELENQELSTDQ
nr:helix-turn-helix domain-containing protein [uncultured Chryseobacterium sp.]